MHTDCTCIVFSMPFHSACFILPHGNFPVGKSSLPFLRKAHKTNLCETVMVFYSPSINLRSLLPTHLSSLFTDNLQDIDTSIPAVVLNKKIHIVHSILKSDLDHVKIILKQFTLSPAVGKTCQL